MSDGPWTFGSFVLDGDGFRLLNGSRPVALERMALELLVMLVERHGELVRRGEIAARLWHGDAEVDTEAGLHTVVRKLRAALGDSAERPLFIETVPGKGYRFIASVFATVTVAVLPFVEASGGMADEHVADGLTDALIGALGRMAPERLRVIARTSSMAYKGARRTAQEIGRELGVHYLLEGTLRRENQRWRIAATLVRTRDHLQVWSEVYYCSLAELPSFEGELAVIIARQVGVTLPFESRAPAEAPTHDPDAHDLYLRGRWYWQQRQPEAMLRAEQCFLEAIAKTPSYAPPYAALASLYVVQILINTADPTDRWTRARQAAETALQLESDLGEAHAATAMMDYHLGWDWASAERSFRRAIDLNPNDAIARQFYAQLLSNSLRHDEAVAEIDRARAIDPLAPVMHTFAAGIYMAGGRHDAGFAAVRHALTLDPDHFPGHAVLGHLHDRTGEPEKALAAYRTAHRLSRGNPFMLGFQGWVLGRTGPDDGARQIIATLEQISRSRPVPPSAFALVFAGLGDCDTACLYLDRAYMMRDVFLITLPRALVEPTSFRPTIRQPDAADRFSAASDRRTLKMAVVALTRRPRHSTSRRLRCNEPRTQYTRRAPREAGVPQLLFAWQLGPVDGHAPPAIRSTARNVSRAGARPPNGIGRDGDRSRTSSGAHAD